MRLVFAPWIILGWMMYVQSVNAGHGVCNIATSMECIDHILDLSCTQFRQTTIPPFHSIIHRRMDQGYYLLEHRYQLLDALPLKQIEEGVNHMSQRYGHIMLENKHTPQDMAYSGWDTWKVTFDCAGNVHSDPEARQRLWVSVVYVIA